MYKCNQCKREFTSTIDQYDEQGDEWYTLSPCCHTDDFDAVELKAQFRSIIESNYPTLKNTNHE
jgi:hypothetical protein